jgi:hypothetical protein
MRTFSRTFFHRRKRKDAPNSDMNVSQFDPNERTADRQQRRRL